MSNPFVGEIRMFGGTFAPAGWAFCSGQLMPISENDTLFNLIGTTYGGDGQETFALPDLQGRIPMHAGTGASGTTYQLGEKGGTESVTLTTNQIPGHNHPMTCNNAAGNNQSPNGNISAGAQTGVNIFSTFNPIQTMDPNAISIVGGSQPHENVGPYLVLSFILSLFGIFPHQ